MAPRLGLGGGVTADPSKNLFNLLLDNYPAKAAFALRKLRRSYTGYAVKVREGAGEEEADVGFDPTGVISLSSPLANKTGGEGTTLGEFVGAGDEDSDAYITVLYDQSGNGNNATETTTSYQPTLVDGGSLVTSGGLPAVQFTNLNNLEIAGLSNTSYLDSWYVIDNSDWSYLYPSDGTTTDKFGPVAANGSGSGNPTGNNYGSITLYVNGAATSPSDRDDTHDFLNGRKLVHHFSGSVTSWDNFQFGRYDNQSSSSQYNLTAKVQEMLFYDSDQSSNRTSIDANLNDHYSIY